MAGPGFVLVRQSQLYFWRCIRNRTFKRKMMMKKSVLLIDDEKDLCEVVSRALKKEGFEVDCAYNLAQAEEKLRSHPDIVLLDNNLPDGTGLEYIQMHPVSFMQSFVIMISADPSSAWQKGAGIEGIQAVLPKPFSILRMREIISTHGCI